MRRRVDPLDAINGDGDVDVDAGRRRRHRAVRVLGLGGAVAGVAGVLAFGVLPTRTWLDQRSASQEAEDRLAQLEERNAALERRIEQLDDDDVIERLAREQYNLVYPGEEAYAILPAPLPTIAIPDLW